MICNTILIFSLSISHVFATYIEGWLYGYERAWKQLHEQSNFYNCFTIQVYKLVKQLYFFFEVLTAKTKPKGIEMSLLPKDPPSVYELLREANILRNTKILESLGIEDANLQPVEGSSKPRKTKAKPTDEEKAILLLERRISLRRVIQ